MPRLRARPRILLLALLASLVATTAELHAAPVFTAKAMSFDVGTGVSGLAVADFDGDSHPDYIVPNGTLSYGVSIFWGLGNGLYGTKLTLAAAANPKGVAIADLNGDGRPDLA